MVKFGGEIGTLYQFFLMLKNAFYKTPPAKQDKCSNKGGGGVKGLLNNVQKNCTFLAGWLPLSLSFGEKRPKFMKLD